MLPHLPGVNGAEAGPPVQVPPPPHLRLPGHIVEAGWDKSSFAMEQRGKSLAQNAGLRYESKVLQALAANFGGDFYSSPALHFVDQRGHGLAIPDALILGSGWIVCVEVKFQHMPEAWWQLRKKYEPILRKIYPEHKILLLEICRSLDASQPFPEKYDYVEIPRAWISGAEDGALGVFQWKL